MPSQDEPEAIDDSLLAADLNTQQQPARPPSVETQQHGGVNFGTGSQIDTFGDVVGQDKIGGDKVGGNKFTTNIYPSSPVVTRSLDTGPYTPYPETGPHYWPRISGLSINPKELEQLRTPMKWLLWTYVIGAACLIGLALLQGFAPDAMGPMIRLGEVLGFGTLSLGSGEVMRSSLLFFIGCVVIFGLIYNKILNKKILLSPFLVSGMLSVLYLFCGLLYILMSDWRFHLAILLLFGLFFLFVFFRYSLVNFYLRIRSYGDIVVEGISLSIFIVFFIHLIQHFMEGVNR